MRPGRGSQILAAYRFGINEGNATFEAIAPAWEVLDAARSPSKATAEYGRWVAAAPVFGQGAYVGGVEHSVASSRSDR